MELELNPENKTAIIRGLTAESLGALKSDNLTPLLDRIAALESKQLANVYNLQLGVETTKILSINNSLIGTTSGAFDTANVFKSLATAIGKDTNWVPLTSNGTSLEQRWAEGSTPTTPRGIINVGGLSNIILQELSDRPLIDKDLFFQYMRLFVGAIRDKQPYCNIYVYDNWAYNTATDYQADTTTIDTYTKQIAIELGIKIIPCSIGWNIIRLLYGFSSLNLYYDNKHPTLAGIYLNALINLGVILNADPLINSFVPTGLSISDAAKLRDAAKKALTATASYPYKESTFNATTIKAGVYLDSNTFRASTIQLYVKDINWNNGSGLVTSPNGSGSLNSSMGYPTVNTNCILIYQDPLTPIEVLGIPSAPQLITGLDPTKPIWITVNDSNYANNSGGFTFGWR